MPYPTTQRTHTSEEIRAARIAALCRAYVDGLERNGYDYEWLTSMQIEQTLGVNHSKRLFPLVLRKFQFAFGKKLEFHQTKMVDGERLRNAYNFPLVCGVPWPLGLWKHGYWVDRKGVHV